MGALAPVLLCVLAGCTSTGGFTSPFLMTVLPFTQMRLTLSVVPELKIAAGLAVVRT